MQNSDDQKCMDSAIKLRSNIPLDKHEFIYRGKIYVEIPWDEGWDR